MTICPDNAPRQGSPEFFGKLRRTLPRHERVKSTHPLDHEYYNGTTYFNLKLALFSNSTSSTYLRIQPQAFRRIGRWGIPIPLRDRVMTIIPWRLASKACRTVSIKPLSAGSTPLKLSIRSSSYGLSWGRAGKTSPA